MAVVGTPTWLNVPSGTVARKSGVSYQLEWTFAETPTSTVGYTTLTVTDMSDSSTLHTATVSTVDSSRVWSASLDPYGIGMADGGTYTISIKGYITALSAYGPTATSGAITAYEPVTLTITSPNDNAVLSSVPVTVNWTASVPLTRQSSLLSGTHGALWSYVFPSNWRSLSIPAEWFVEGESYTFTLSATDENGFSASDTVHFTLQWSSPEEPTATVSNNDTDMSTDITVAFGTDPLYPATDHAMVVRVVGDDRYVIDDSVADGVTVTDHLPPLGVAYSYEVYSVTSDGKTASKTVSNTFTTTSWVLNAGGAALIKRFNPQAAYTLNHGGASYHFADGGQGGGLPVFYPTTDRDESGTLQFDTVGHTESDSLVAVSKAHPVMHLRDPFGHRWRAHVTPSVSHGVGQVWHISLAWDAVRWEE